jgi:integrase
VTRDQVLDHFAEPAEPAGGPTVAAWVADYVEHLSAISGSTRREYKSIVRWHIEGTALGAAPLGAITRDDVRAWVRHHEGRSAPKSIGNFRALLSAALAEAVHAGRIGANPCTGIRLPRRDNYLTRDATATFLTPAQVEKLAQALPERYGFIPPMLARTGLRWGELTALTVDDLALDAKPPTLTVARAWKRDEVGQFYVGPPKTRRSRRTIALDAATCCLLRPLVAGKRPSDLIVTAPNGRDHLPHSTFLRHWHAALVGDGTPEKPGLIAAGVVPRSVRIHDLRHTHASWLISAGVPLPVIQRRLGHESISTTVNVYGHLLPETDQTVVAALDAAI